MICWMRYLFVAVVTILGVGSIISACGQKGDLYLPESKPPARTTAESASGDDVPVPSPQTGSDTR